MRVAARQVVLLVCAFVLVFSAITIVSNLRSHPKARQSSPPTASQLRTAAAQRATARRDRAAELAATRHDDAVERELTALHRAASRADRSAAARAQRQLNRLAGSDPKPAAKSTAADPFQRMLDEFAFKRSPLFVQQVTSGTAHRVYVGVDRTVFCLQGPAARRAAVDDVYRRADRRLHAADVTDLELVVVALTNKAATFDQALAVGRRGSVRLTRRGQACRSRSADSACGQHDDLVLSASATTCI